MSDDSTTVGLFQMGWSPDLNKVLAARDLGAVDPGLDAVCRWFSEQRNVQDRFAAALRQSFDEVLDGQRTGRFDLEKLEKTEKTYLGTKIEIVIRAAFDLPRGLRMDYRIAEHDVDCKFSMRSSWSIPSEAIGHLCLLVAASDRRGVFDVGLIRIVPEILNVGRNKDGKTTITKAARAGIVWLCRDAPLPENLLLSLPVAVVDAIQGTGSGQQRINELFRQVQGRIVDRNTAITVARQHDGPKRCRDARIALRGEGIIILGHQKQSPIIARQLGLPVPYKGSFLAVRLIRVSHETVDRAVFRLDSGTYAVADVHDPIELAPLLDL